MNIVALVGSIRQESIHRQIFKHYQENCRDYFTLEEVPIKDIPLFDGDEKTIGAVEKLSQKIRQADGVIFFSPEYNYSVSGVLKNAIDWISRTKPQPFVGKPASIIGASPGNIATARMQYHLRQIGVFLDIRFMNKLEVMIGGVFGKIQEGRITDQPTIDHLLKHAESFKDFVEAT